MPRYIYTAKSHPHKIIQGEIEAETQAEAINKLTQMGYFPVSVKPEILLEARTGFFRLSRISGKELSLFTGQLSNLIESGVNILESLAIISNQSKNKYFRAVLNDVIGKIKDGSSLSESLAAYPDIFSNLFTSLIHTGEASGRINETLKRLANFLEKEEEFKNSLRSSLTYPAFVFVAGVVTVMVLFLFVIPRLVSMFEDMGEVLPLPTRLLINISSFMRNYWWIILTVFFAIVFMIRRIYKSQQGRVFLDKLRLRLGVLGEIILKTEIGSLARMLSLLLSSGVPITSSLEISMSIVENQILKSEIQRFKDEIANGASLSSSLGTSEYIPEFVTNVVRIGEETGALDESLMRIAIDFEKDVDRTLKTFSRLLEPVVILIMGLFVGFIVLSMLLPIFQINLIVR
jgi:type II secretory pathway component PulF